MHWETALHHFACMAFYHARQWSNTSVKTLYYKIFEERKCISENEMTKIQLYIYLNMFCTFNA
jgi:hypothetical protein